MAGGDPLDGLLTELRTHLVGALEVAEACLRFATIAAQSPGYQFNSSKVRALDVRAAIESSVPVHIDSVLAPEAVNGVADAIQASGDRPLAAWFAAARISVAISQSFTAHMVDAGGGDVYELGDLTPFCVALHACEALYGHQRFSERITHERFPGDPSQVNGLALWRDVDSSFHVTVDTVGGAQFNACLDDGVGLTVALLAPNRDLTEIVVDEISMPGEADRNFFRVRPADPAAQEERIAAGLREAGVCGAGIALLPELVTTAERAESIGQRLHGGELLPKNTGTLRVVVGGSYHHVDTEGVQRNTTRVHFPRSSRPPFGPMEDRQHSKSGAFFMDFPAELLSMLRPSQDPAEYNGDLHFRENVEPAKHVTLYVGDKFTAIVAICADLLDTTFRRVLRRLRPSLLLVCNMTYKSEGFVDCAHALIGDGQTTSVMVNNPCHWFGDDGPDGVIVGVPLLTDRVRRLRFEDDERVAVFATQRTGGRPSLTTVKGAG